MSGDTGSDRTATVADEARRLGPWFHNLHLPCTVQTAPEHFLGDYPRYKWELIEPHLPADLSGCSVLDVGCNGGFYAIALADRGADVLAVDHDVRYLEQARWAVRQYGFEKRVRFAHCQVYDLARDSAQFDLVLFMGVLYHLRYPMLGLDIVAHKTRGTLVFQSLLQSNEKVFHPQADYRIDERHVFEQPGWPATAFIEHRFSNDPTNWWVPNRAGVEAMLRSAGLHIQQRIDPDIYICAPDGSTFEERCPGNTEEYVAAAGLSRAVMGERS